jgi:hypothetical protein
VDFRGRTVYGRLSETVQNAHLGDPVSDQSKDLRCRMGKHHYVGVMDDNPEMRGQGHLECTRCGHVKDINSYTNLSQRGSTGLGPAGGIGGG